VTRTEPRGLVVELAEGFGQHGYVVDDGEQEVGVRCVAAPVPGAPSPCAVSVSGPVGRLGAHDVTRIGALVREAADRLGGELAGLPAAPGTLDDLTDPFPLLAAVRAAGEDAGRTTRRSV